MDKTVNDGRWIRIPLIGDVKGIVVLLPPEPLSEQNWQQFLRSLEVMKPGLVEPDHGGTDG